jgi:dTDP-4-amino-4,6-dideoxygalactose transaminase
MTNRQVSFCRPSFADAEREALTEVLQSGWWTTGPRTKEFEKAFAAYLGVADAAAVSSCTAALHLALAAYDIGPGDEVLVPSLTFVASAEVAFMAGARPVLTDVCPQTHNVRVEDLERAITPRTKAVVAVHFNGVPCDMDAIGAWCRERDLILIEDCAHAIETTWRGRHAGTMADVGCFSFYANKNLATGEGGMIVCRDPEKLARVRRLMLHGMSRDAWKRFSAAGQWRYDIVEPGYKYNLTDFASSLGLVQLGRIAENSDKRRALAIRYREAFSGIPGISFQTVPEGAVEANHLFLVRVAPPGRPGAAALHRDAIIDRLKDAGIVCAVHYIPLHRMSSYEQAGFAAANFPNAEALGEATLSLPFYPDLSFDDQDYVISRFREAVRPATANVGAQRETGA